MPRPLTIVDALADQRLFGGVSAFRDLSSWGRWVVFLKSVYGLELDGEETAIFTEHTGRSRYDPPVGGWSETVAVVGRQSGKSRVASVIAGFEALRAECEGDRTETWALLIAQDQRAALRTLLGYAKAPFAQVPALQRSVAATRADSMTLRNGVVLAAYPARPASVRGLRARVAVLDELAFFRNSENVPIDVEMLRAIRPCLSTTRGKLLILSSPYAKTGALYDLHRRHFGQVDSETLVWAASAPAMNPRLPSDYLARMERDDPEAYRSEVLGEFRSGTATFLDPEVLAACVDEGIRERPPQAGLFYRGFFDPSGGRRDAAALGIAHSTDDGAVLDLLRAWSPPFNPSGAIAEAADELARYALSTVQGDRYAGEFVAEAFRAHDITYEASVRDRSAIYHELLPLVQSHRVRLLDHPDLLRELRGLERRRGASGRDRIDHAPSAHDDRANAASGAVVLAAAPTTPLAFTFLDSATDADTDAQRAGSAAMVQDAIARDGAFWPE